MTPTLRIFVDRLAELHGSTLQFTFSEGPPTTITIPAKHEIVGDLTIYDDGDELTIEIGRKHHAHFSSYNYDQNPEATRLNLVARHAAEFVDDVMRDRVCITVDFNGDRCIGSSHFYVDGDQSNSSRVRSIGAFVGEDRSERFLWSGPIE